MNLFSSKIFHTRMPILATISILGTLFPSVISRGLLLLYRPLDISNECALSQQLRYDLSFGMGMSDTITLVFRTLTEIDYECGVEITTDYKDERIEIIIVIRYPNTLAENCALNPDAFSVIKKDTCIRLCERTFTRDEYSPFFTFSTQKKVRFRFISNSSINSDMNAHLYEVTATSARRKDPSKRCNPFNETVCNVGASSFCFTSGVVCDGIKNCGVSDWFDERKSECELPIPTLGYTPIVAIVAALLCAMLALIHIMLKCLPPLASSFFIFNANEDNRLCINPFFKVPEACSLQQRSTKKDSIIPVSLTSTSTSSESATFQSTPIIQIKDSAERENIPDAKESAEDEAREKKKTTMKAVTASIQRKFRSVGRSVSGRSS